MRLTIAPFLLWAAMALTACGQSTANEYPASARAQFGQTCPAGDPVCDCTWEQLTEHMTYEEYQAALERYGSEGLMDPRVTRARTFCLEHRRS